MNDKEQIPTQVVITQDKLVDLLMHSATREDIAKLDSKIDSSIDKLDSKIDISIDKLDSKIDSSMAKLDSKIDSRFDALITEFKRANEVLEARIDRQFQKIDHRYNWIIGVTIGTGIAVSGLMIALVSFVIKLH